MAKETHAKANGKPPITRHPLFPATVALWFGALFGLGSLAIRPALLESLIVTLKIDAVITSAAPPIGVTTRILLALAMAGFGGLLGATLARRIGRPKPVVRQRQRKAGPASEAHTAHEALSFARRVETVPEDTPAREGRRDRLAMAEETSSRKDRDHYVERAPVPGANPHILDVSEFDLEGFEASPAEVAKAPAYEEPHQPAPAAPEDAAVDPPAFAPPPAEQEIPENAQVFVVGPEPAAQPLGAASHSPFTVPDHSENGAPFAPEPTAVRAFDAPGPNIAAPIEPADEDAPAMTPFGLPQQIDAVEASHPSTEPPFAVPDVTAGEAPEPEADYSSTEPPFAVPDIPVDDEPSTVKAPFAGPGIGSEPESTEAHEQAFDEPKAEDLPRLFNGETQSAAAATAPAETEAKPSNSSVFDAEPAPGLFTQPLNAQVSRINWPDGLAHSGTGEAPAEAAEPGPASDVPAANEHVHETPETEQDPAVSRVTSANLADLSHLELLERLAVAMRRKQGTKQSGQTEVKPPFQSGTVAAPEPAMPEPPVPDAAPAEHAPFAMPQTAAAQPDEPAIPPAFAQPAATNDAAPAEHVAPPPSAVPAALRPIGLDPEDDADLIPAQVPPRHISAAGGQFSAPSALAQANPGAQEADEDTMLADGYSSLLGLSRPEPASQRFVRIEEPEDLSGEIEPVVVFPGQENSPPAPFAQPVAGSDEAAASPAPFAKPADMTEGRGSSEPPAPGQAPSAAQADQPPPFAQRPDSDETERALRSALATLQRMSGAA